MDRNTTGVIALGGAIVLLIGLIIAVQSGTFGESDSIFGANEGEDPLLRECLADHSDLAAHYHPLLTITVNGDQMRIDPNTGIGILLPWWEHAPCSRPRCDGRGTHQVARRT